MNGTSVFFLAILVRVISFAGDLVQKSARGGWSCFPPFSACQREGHGELFLGPGDADIAKSPFFGDIFFLTCLDAATVRQDSQMGFVMMRGMTLPKSRLSTVSAALRQLVVTVTSI